MNDNHKSPLNHHCMIVHNYYPFAETRVQRQTEALTEYNYKVDVICMRQDSEPTIENVGYLTIYRLPLKRNKKKGPLFQFVEYLTFMVLTFFKITSLHLRQRYTTVQVHNLPDFLVFAAIIPRFTGSRVILDLHDLMPEFYCAKFNSIMTNLPVRLIRWQEWLSCRFAHHVITVTESWRQTLIQRGVAEYKCSVVMNVADPQYFNSDVTPNGSQKDGELHLVYHGTITQRYGLDMVLYALAQIRSETPNIRFTVQGRGEFLETILHLIKELNLNDLVYLNSDFLPVTELSKVIKSADLGIVPYRRDIFTDGILPTKLMEYAAVGVPAIAAKTPGISAYFDENMVEFFTPEDVEDLALRIRTLYKNRSRLQELTHNIKKFNQKYNWSTQKTKYVNLLDGLAKH